MAPAPAADIAAAVSGSGLMAKYGQDVDRQSAYEMLTARVAPTAPPGVGPVTIPTVPSVQAGTGGPTLGADGWPTLTPEPYNPYTDDTPAATPAPRAPKGQSPGQPSNSEGGGIGEVLNNPIVTSFMRSLGSSLGGALGRSVFGTRKRRR
jgi:hypothetical protein